MERQAFDIDWNKTKAFLLSAEKGSFSAAAKALKTSQATLSRQVAALEKELGLVLFERSAQGLELTSSGAKLFEHAKHMADSAFAFSLAATGQAESLVGNVVISVCELDAIYRLPLIISKLRIAEPGITLEIIVSNTASDLKRREADIAIRSFRPSQDQIVARKVGEECLGLFGSKSYLLKHRSSMDEHNSMADLQVIAFDQSHVIEEQLKTKNIALTTNNVKLITSNQAMQVQLCKHELGLIYFACDMANQEPQLQQAYSERGPLLRLPIWVVCHEEIKQNQRVKRVYDFLANELQQYFESHQ